MSACSDPATPPLSLDDAGRELLAVAGTRQPIAWTPGASSGAVDVALVGADGVEHPVATGVPDTGAFTMQVPLVGAGDFRVRLRDAAGGPETGIGYRLTTAALVGLSWNPILEQEEYSWIDAVTGTTMVLGTAGDLRWWEYKGGAAFDPAAGTVYATGSIDDTNTVDKIYTLDGASGALLATATLSGPRPSGLLVNAAGTVLGFQTSETALDVVAVDPSTGALSTLASVPGPFAGWSVEHAIDLAADRVYHIALAGLLTDPAPVLTVYSIDATTGALVGSAPITLGGAPVEHLGGVRLDAAGQLIGFAWDDLATVERMLAIDPATGVATALGTVGDLHTWSEQVAYNPTTGEALVFGNDAADQPRLYAMDGTTGALLYDVAVPALPTAALLVY